MSEQIQERFRKLMDRIRGAPYIDEKELDNLLRELQKILLQSDVNVKVVFDLTNRIRERIKEERRLSTRVPLKDLVIKVLYEELVKILGGEQTQLHISRDKKPFNILFIGLEGSGKTTTVAKLAKLLSNKGYRVGVVSLDLYRPAAIDQLRQLIESIDSEKVVFIDPDEYGDVGNRLRKALDTAKYLDIDVLLIDTAGRHKNEESLLEELSEINRLLNPDYTILVIDAYMGQKAYDHSKHLSERVRIDGIIITKMDGTGKGGGAISAAYASGGKVIFLGMGEKLDDLEEYNPKSFVARLLGLGDLEGLLKRVERLARQEDEAELLKRLSKGRITLIDVINQLEQIESMGGLYKVLSYLPGIGDKVKREEIEEMERKLKKWRVAVDSMTLEEKLDPTLIKGSRLTRISRGSGVDERTIKELVKQYNLMRKAFRDRRHRRLLKDVFR